jgi:hypothetical protein
VANPWNVTDETVEPLPSAAPPAPSASDVSFWNSNSYRSGGDDWNQFLAIDSPDAPESDESGAAILVTGGSLDGLRDDTQLASPMSELVELADYHEAATSIDGAPTVPTAGFEFLAETSDDLLPDR